MLTSISGRLDAARSTEAAAESSSREALPRVNAAQETWYGLAGLRERVASTLSIATERVRNAALVTPEDRPGRDPDALEAEAAEARAAEAALAAQVDVRSRGLEAAAAQRAAAESAYSAAEKRHAAHLRALADRREGLARLAGEVDALRSRIEAADGLAEAVDLDTAWAAWTAVECSDSDLFYKEIKRITGTDDGFNATPEQWREVASAAPPF